MWLVADWLHYSTFSFILQCLFLPMIKKTNFSSLPLAQFAYNEKHENSLMTTSKIHSPMTSDDLITWITLRKKNVEKRWFFLKRNVLQLDDRMETRTREEAQWPRVSHCFNFFLHCDLCSLEIRFVHRSRLTTWKKNISVQFTQKSLSVNFDFLSVNYV